MSTVEDNLDLLTSIYKKYSPSIESYRKTEQCCVKKLFSRSKNGTIYGMFYPYEEMTKFFKYCGKLVSEEDSYDNVYFFDKNDRLLLTRQILSDKAILSFTLFYYYDSYIDAVWYSTEKGVDMIARYEKTNGVLTRYIEGDYIKDGVVQGFEEFIFPLNVDEKITRTSFAKGVCFDGKDMSITNSFAFLMEV